MAQCVTQPTATLYGQSTITGAPRYSTSVSSSSSPFCFRPSLPSCDSLFSTLTWWSPELNLLPVLFLQIRESVETVVEPASFSLTSVRCSLRDRIPFLPSLAPKLTRSLLSSSFFRPVKEREYQMFQVSQISYFPCPHRI